MSKFVQKGERNLKHWTRRRQPFDVRAWRMRMGLTQLEAKRLLKCGLSTIKRWERPSGGDKPYPKNVARMKELESIKAAGLLTGPVPTTPPHVRRRMQEPSVGTGRPTHVTIAPSSF